MVFILTQTSPTLNGGLPRKRPVSTRRAQKSEATRLEILEAAGKIIGKYGYAGCSIARVTAKAKISHGAFYLHFSSQKDMFNQVLPTLGAEMLKMIADAIVDVRDISELEQRGLEANFAYLTKHPYIYRVLSEAELFAPEAFHAYHDDLAHGYARSLRRSRPNDLGSDDEYETLATMLIGARTYLLMRYGVTNHVIKPLPPGKLEAYLKFVADGINGYMASR
ncbi:TetR/AcrR family transcriptional regulator [Novosphingobium sp.]|uniref:TetR/AcrR family transcriptional regulator n=1 Tax=Novosphingobium sp. TaxID=1874826 RepID=UPI00286E7294|nr:TetR/AcrR family transcriptional regulator [Novosphingobium sp.]